ncbi:MAG: hypothetical protein KAJ49_07645, partial [Arcobacteraceae bacterium]|nr:hypothetical protein [Arcobacteraceae bacterium]
MKLDNINDYIIDFSLAINIGKSKLIEYGIFPIKEFGIYILVAIINEQIDKSKIEELFNKPIKCIKISKKVFEFE